PAAGGPRAHGEGGQGEEGAVDGVGGEPVVAAGAHDAHGASVWLLGAGGDLAADLFGSRGRYTREGLLPGGGARLVGVVVTARPGAGKAVTAHSVLGEQQVENGGDEVSADLTHRNAPP